MIKRDNYEAFFLDYYEGNLSPEQVKELYSFLEANPDLREAFEEYENISLKDIEDTILDPKDIFADKDILKREEITSDNIDEYIILYNDNALSLKDCDQLERFLKKNPSYSALKREYKKTILEQDASIVFLDKADLKKDNLEITADNEEEKLIEYSEGQMHGLYASTFEQYLSKNPNQVVELKKFQATKLVADKSIVFPDKQELYDIPKKKKRGLFYFTIAAAGLLLFFFSYTLIYLTANVKESKQYSSHTSGAENKLEKNQTVPIERFSEKKNVATNTLAKKTIRKGLKSTRKIVKVALPDLKGNNFANPAIAKKSIPDTIGSIALNKKDTANSFPANERGVFVYSTSSEEKAATASPIEYLSMKEVFLKKIRSSSKVKNNDPDCVEKKNKFTMGDLVALCATMIKKIGGSDVEVVTEENACGDAVAVIVRTNNWQFEKLLMK